MTELEIVRRIRGNVHGTVDVTALEDHILAHPYVQRLRRIKQLAFLSFVFPGATHSRLEHSLGVMQLAGITWSKLYANQKRLANACSRYRDFAKTEMQGSDGLVHGLLDPTFPIIAEIFASPYTLQALRLAGFLHDIGHPPFSHSGERFMPSWKDVVVSAKKNAPAYLQAYLERKCDEQADRGRDPAKSPVRHEVYTLLLVDRLLNDVYRTWPPDKIRIAPRDIVAIIAPEVGPAEGSPLIKHGIYRLCNEIVSGEVDIDRMDYLMRDSRECGVVYGIFDATRIQDSLALYFDPNDAGVHLAISFSGLAAFEDYLRARQSMYLQLYFHKTSVAAEAMMAHLSRMLGGWTLPVGVEDYADVDEYNIEGALLKASERLQDGDDKAKFRELLMDLLRTRRLWKRVYEVAGRDSGEASAIIQQACTIIHEMGCDYERVSSSSSLTNFKPREAHEVSRNYLRLIKKDEYQFPRVCPIEDHSSLIAANQRINITRIYVPDETTPDGTNLPAMVKQTLTERLRG